MVIINMLALLLLRTLAGVQADEYCRGLALEGGGSLGAYQAGALLALTQLLSPPEVEWNVVSGISTGSLNAAGVSLFPMGQEADMAQFIQDVWLSLDGSASVYEDWNALGAPYGLLFESGMYSTEPLRQTITQKVTHPPYRNVTLGSTDLNTGHFATFNESMGLDIVEAVMCSAAPPLYFPPQSFQGTYWADGGCVLNLDVFSAVKRCLDVVPDESHIIIDMIFCTGDNLPPLSVNPSVYEVKTRASDISSYDSAMWYAYAAMQAYPDINFRYTIIPSQNMPRGGLIPLDFNSTSLEAEIALGQSDVARILGELHRPRDLAEEWKQKRYNKARTFRR